MTRPDPVVRIDRVTTRGGDGGMTSLGDGARVAKSAPLIAAIGDVDEANAALGIVAAALEPAHPQRQVIANLQSALFDLGADLCQPNSDRPACLIDQAVLQLEAAAEQLRAVQPPLTSFVLPGGTPAAAHAHLARTIARRAERTVVAAGRWPDGGPQLRLLNRLSDYLFVLARHLNRDGQDDILWVPSRTI